VTEPVADAAGNPIATVRAYCPNCRFTWRTPTPIETGPYMVRCPSCRHVVVIRSAG